MNLIHHGPILTSLSAFRVAPLYHSDAMSATQKAGNLYHYWFAPVHKTCCSPIVAPETDFHV